MPILQGTGKHWDTEPSRKEQDVLIENRLWGLLIAHHCASPRQWEPSETELLFSLSTQVALAIQQAELYQQAQVEVFRQRRMASQLSKLNRSVRMLLECNKLLVQATEELKLLQDICRIVTAVGGYQLAWVGLTDDATQYLSVKGEREKEEREEGKGKREKGCMKKLALLSPFPFHLSPKEETCLAFPLPLSPFPKRFQV